MKIFKADEAKARVAEYKAEIERINQKKAEEIAEQVFDEIRTKSAEGATSMVIRTHDNFDIRDRIITILVSVGYKVTNDFTRLSVSWSE